MLSLFLPLWYNTRRNFTREIGSPIRTEELDSWIITPVGKVPLDSIVGLHVRWAHIETGGGYGGVLKH